MALTELQGQRSDPVRVVVEAGPVRVFADALGDDAAVYRDDTAPVPPTFPFVLPYWGSQGQGGAATLPMERLRGPGRAVLHGEQEFEYLAWPRVGDVLEGVSTVTDVYEKERADGGAMEFYVTETEWRTVPDGDVAVRARFTLVITVRPARTEG